MHLSDKPHSPVHSRRTRPPCAALLLALAAWFAVAAAHAQEAPDRLIKRVVAEVTSAIDADRDLQAGDRAKITALVSAKVFPHLELEAMTRAAAGRHWPRATPEQQKALIREFSRLLINTYAGAFTAYRPDTVIEYKPMRMAPGATEAVVRSLVKAHMGDSMQLDYYLELAGGAWKVVDINVLGARLIETYKNQFNGAISSDGIDGLIKTMAARNKATEERYRS